MLFKINNSKYENAHKSNLNSNSVYLLDKSPLGGLNINELFKNQNYNINTSQNPTLLESINYDDYFKKQSQNQNQMNEVKINYNDIFSQQQNNNNYQGGVDINSLLSQNQNYNINQNAVPQSPHQNIGLQYNQNNLNTPQQVQMQHQVVKSVNLPQYKQYSPINSPKKVIQLEQMSPYNPLYISQQLTNNINNL